MSKVYALSGLRVAYLVADTAIAKRLRKITPPWAVSLPAQCAAIHALNDAEYYRPLYAETHRLRGSLAESLRRLGAGEVIQSSANFVLWQCPHPRLLVQRAQERGLYMRVFTFDGEPYIRLAVKDATTNDRMISIIEGCLNELQSPATVLPPPAWPTAGAVALKT